MKPKSIAQADTEQLKRLAADLEEMGEETEEVEEPEEATEAEEDILKMDVPMFIRLIEWARETAENDVDLHVLADNLLKMGDKVLDINDYDTAMEGLDLGD